MQFFSARNNPFAACSNAVMASVIEQLALWLNKRTPAI